MDYDEWQSKLSDEFFSAGRPDEPIIMFIDDEELVRICPAIPDPVESLRSAVLAELRQTDKSTIFEHIDRRFASWKKGPQDLAPPFLPLLAITVLAGSRMRNDGDFSSSAYYPRLISLMSTPTNTITAAGIKKHFIVVAQMWQTLDNWIEKNQNHVGASTIHTHETFNRIGYPLSQTVLKASDRQRLAGFFERLNVDRELDPTPNQLVAKLRLWLDKPRGFSQAFLKLIQAGSENPLLLAVISKLATEQNSEFPGTDSRIRLGVSLRIDPEDWSVKWVIPVHPQLESDELKGDDGRLLTIRKPEYGSVYDLIVGCLPQDNSMINAQFRAIGNSSILVKKVRQVWILCIDPISGRWQSVSAINPGEEHLLVIPKSDVAEMNELLSRSAAPGYWKFKGDLFPDWAIYVDVSFVESINLSEVGFDSLGQLLKTPPSSQARLVNGLKLRTDVGGRHYMLGGEPDLQLPMESSAQFVEVILDGKTPGTRMKPNGSLFPLRLVGPFVAGKHVVSVGTQNLEFFVHASGFTTQFEVANRNCDDHGFPESEEDRKVPHYVVLRRGKNAAAWFVTRAGTVRRCVEPSIPQSLTRLGLPVSYLWKVPIPEGTNWFITERAGKFSDPNCVAADLPSFEGLDAVAQFFWRRVAQETINNPDPLWRAYLSQSIKDSIYGQ